MPSPELEALRVALRAAQKAATSSQSDKAGRKLTAGALALDSTLRGKLIRCGSRDPDKDKRYDCGRPACPVCSGRRSTRYVKKALWPALTGVSPNDLRWVTVVTNASVDLHAGAEEMARHHRALKHIIANLAPSRRIRVFGAREIDIYRPSDISTLSASKQELLAALGCSSAPQGSVFVFHFHLIVDLDGTSVKRLDDALRGRWTGLRQVHIQPLNAKRTLRANLIMLNRYPAKVRMTREVGNSRREWLEDHEMASLAEGLERLGPRWGRFTLGVRVSA